MHDYDIYKKNHPIAPKDVVNVFDLGYIGIEKDFSEQLSLLPYKKKRGRGGCYNRGNKLQSGTC